MAPAVEQAWRCYARPASLGGRTCGQLNTKGTVHRGLCGDNVCCEHCGATKHAGELRLAKGDVDSGVPREVA